MMGRIICVHGIGDAPPDFWKAWSTVIKAAIGDGDAYDGAWWEGALGDRATRARSQGHSLVRPLTQSRGSRAAGEDELRDQLNALFRLNERRIQDARGDRAKALPRGGLWDYVGDFVRYLVDEAVRARVQDAVRKVFLAPSSAEVSIVAHSWGTVVAYDVLHQLARQRPGFRCTNFVTLGSPLWLEPVRQILADQGQHRKPANTGRWINAYNTFDPVGAALAGGLDGFYEGSLDRDEQVTFPGFNAHAVLKYLGDDDVVDLLREAFRGIGLRVLLRAAHVSRKAVVIGINNYDLRAPKLNGSVNDALQMADMLRRYYGFENANIRVVTDERATQQAILARLEWLVADARGGDELVFHFSGHGSQVADRDGDELDQLDEIICPYDMDWDHPLTDDVFQRYFGRLAPDVSLTVVLDCCHSGTGLRDVRLNTVDRFLLPPPDIRSRVAEALDDLGPFFSATLRDPSIGAAPPAVRAHRPLRNAPRPFLRALATQPNGPLLISGCRADETSADVLIERDYHGALTYALVKSVKEARGRTTYRQLMQEVRRLLPTYGTRQTPQLDGPPTRLARLFITQARPAGAVRPRPGTRRPASEPRRRHRRTRSLRR
jgi:hypothetical protein